MLIVILKLFDVFIYRLERNLLILLMLTLMILSKIYLNVLFHLYIINSKVVVFNITFFFIFIFKE